MTKDDILVELTSIMRDYFDEDDLVLTMSTTAADVPAWDSLAHVNIVAAVEGHFHVRFATAEVELLESVGDLVDLIAKKRGV
jgi:acyl carrier protein